MAYQFAYYDEPIFWTHNSEDKPSQSILNRMVFSYFPKCSVSFVDNFTIRTVLPKNINATILRITDNSPSASLTQQTKYYLLNRTSKVLQNAYEYEGILDAWMTYALPFIKWTQNTSNSKKYPVLINRFLNNRIYHEYMVNETYRKTDEYFNFDNEELNLIGSNQLKIYNQNRGTKIAVSRDKDMFGVNNIKPSPQYDPPEALSKIRWSYWNDGVDGWWNTITLANNPFERQYNKNILFKIFVFQLDTTYENNSTVLGKEAGTYYFLCVPIGGNVRIWIDEDSTTDYFSIQSIGENDSLDGISDLWQSKLKGVYYLPLWKYISPTNDGYSFYLCKYKSERTYRLFFTLPASDYQRFQDDFGIPDTHVKFSPTEIFRFNLLSSTYNYDTQKTEFNIGFACPSVNNNKITTTRINYGTSFSSYDTQNVIEMGTLYNTNVTENQKHFFPLTKKISPYPTPYNILNAYALSRSKVLGAYLTPSFKRIELRDTWYRADTYNHVGSYGYITYNGLNFIVKTLWNNASNIYESNGSMNAFIDGYSVFLNESKASMNAQLTIAKQRSDLASAEAVLGGFSGLAKNTGKLLVGTGTGNVGMTAQGAIGFATGVGSTVTGVIRAQQMYSHAKLSQEAMMVDKRNSALGQTITSNYTDDDYKQKFIFMTGINLPSKENSLGWAPSTPQDTPSLNDDCLSFYDFALINAPLSVEGVNFYNRLTWNVGMKGGFYMPLNEIFKPDYDTWNTRYTDQKILTIRSSNNKSIGVRNPFTYLSLEIPETWYRTYYQYATLEEIASVQSIFSSGVRIWNKAPEYNENDAFYILDTHIVYGDNDPETGLPKTPNEEVINPQNLIEINEKTKEENNPKHETKKRSKKK